MIKNPFSKQELHIIGNRLKELRLNYNEGLTYRELEDKIKISYSRICDLESGQVMPSLNDLYNYQKFFNVSYDYLLGNVESKEETNFNTSQDLGLSDKALKNLRYLRIEKKTDLISYLPEDFAWSSSDSINLLLEDEEVLNKIAEYISFYIKDINLEDYLHVDMFEKDYEVDLKGVIKEIELKKLIKNLDKLQMIIKSKEEHYKKTL